MVSTNFKESDIYDTLIIGGGPSGISNAIHLGFHLRKVIIVDRKSSAMNFHTNPVNNYLGVKPLCTGIEILDKMREELSEYGVQNLTGNVIKIEGECPEFKIHVTPLNDAEENDQKTLMSRTLVFATGTARKHPLVNGDWRNWLPFAGKNEISYYCPDCEAPLTSGKDIIIVNAGTVNSSLYIANCIEPYAKKIRIFMTEDGYIPFTKKEQEVLDNSRYDWVSGFIEEINIEKPGVMQQLVTTSGDVLQCEHFFVSWTDVPRSELAVEIGVQVDKRGNILTDQRGKTNIEGVWAVGDVRPITQSVAMAVGTGNYAAIMINKFLRDQILSM